MHFVMVAYHPYSKHFQLHHKVICLFVYLFVRLNLVDPLKNTNNNLLNNANIKLLILNEIHGKTMTQTGDSKRVNNS